MNSEFLEVQWNNFQTVYAVSSDFLIRRDGSFQLGDDIFRGLERIE